MIQFKQNYFNKVSNVTQLADPFYQTAKGVLSSYWFTAPRTGQPTTTTHVKLAKGQNRNVSFSKIDKRPWVDELRAETSANGTLVFNVHVRWKIIVKNYNRGSKSVNILVFIALTHVASKIKSVKPLDKIHCSYLRILMVLYLHVQSIRNPFPCVFGFLAVKVLDRWF